MRTEVLVVRHAEVHNPKDIVYGRLPRFRLSRRGREQAELAARFVASRGASAVYSSPLLRARQSAEIIAGGLDGQKAHVMSLLVEVRTAYQGRPNTILKPGFSFYHPQADPSDETIEDVWRRMVHGLRLICVRHPGERVVMVSHGDPIAILRLGLEGRDLTSEALHSTVYPARSSITQVQIWPDRPAWLAYFDIVGKGPT